MTGEDVLVDRDIVSSGGMAQTLRGLFDRFCNYGTREVKADLDGAKFTKLCRDCNLLDRSSLTSTDIDIVFAKVKTKGTRKINYPQFEMALDLIAEKKGMEPEALRTMICTAEGPKTNATKAEYVKFYDDKRLYTGVHKRKTETGADDASATITTQLSKQNSKSFR